MLLDERVPHENPKDRDEALGELTKRYFQSHGFAQLQDFTWWSGLTIKDAKRGIEIAKLQKEIQKDKEYWFTKHVDFTNSKLVYLIPPFDEYFVAYKERSDILDMRYSKELNFNGGMIHGSIVYEGIIIGTWKRVFTKKEIIITTHPFTVFTKEEKDAIAKAGVLYGKFHCLPTIVKI